jgi:three-Cys-motif partner protein
MNKSWGGSWTEQKLDVFEKYVKAYLTIMNRHRGNKRLIYFDAFAGSGTRDVQQPTPETQSLLEGFPITEDEVDVYRGSAERVISISLNGFDYYYFVETDDNSRNNLEARLNALDSDNKLRAIYRKGDANYWISQMANAMQKDKTLYSLTLLDPFGMQVDWNSIAKLKGTNTDLWLLIPTGVIINRLLDRDGLLTHIDKLVSHLGLSEDEIRDEFYRQKPVEHGLFGDVNAISKIEQPIRHITELFINRLKTLFPHVTEKPLEMCNSKNCPIYHFAFASNNETAVKIANQIIGRETL